MKKKRIPSKKRIRGDYFSDRTRMLNNVIILMKPVIKIFFFNKIEITFYSIDICRVWTHNH